MNMLFVYKFLIIIQFVFALIYCESKEIVKWKMCSRHAIRSQFMSNSWETNYCTLKLSKIRWCDLSKKKFLSILLIIHCAHCFEHKKVLIWFFFTFSHTIFRVREKTEFNRKSVKKDLKTKHKTGSNALENSQTKE